MGDDVECDGTARSVDALDVLSAAEREAFLGGNARRVLRLP